MPESKEAIILAIKRSLKKKHPKWSEERITESAFKIYNARNKAKESNKRYKEMDSNEEDYRVYGYIATTHKDLHNEQILPETLYKWAEDINGNFPESFKGDLHHDRSDPQLVSIAEYAEVIDLKDGNKGLWVSDFVNTHHRDFKTIRHEIENSMLPAYSIEYDSTHVVKQDDTTYITPDCSLWGYAHANRPVNIHALKTGLKERPNGYNYAKFDIDHKEDIESNTTKEEIIMESKVTPEVQEKELEQKEQTKPSPEIVEKEGKSTSTEDVFLKFKEELEKATLKMKELSAKFDEQPETKPLVMNKELEQKEMEPELPLRFKEMKEAVKNKDWMAFKEVGIEYINENADKYAQQLIYKRPIKTTMKMKCVGNKIEIVGGPSLKYKDILDTGSNPGAYTETSVEFADVFQPGLVEQFNNAMGLLGEIPKDDHLEGTPFYGFTIETARNTAGGAVNPDDITVETGYVPKVKLHQEIKVYRYGVSVTDYTLHHSRASLGNLFQLEVEKAMEAWMDKVHGDLFREGVGTAGTDNQILGLEAVADSTGNATLYGKTRSSFATTLQADTLTDTYVNNNASLVAAEIRTGLAQLRTEGSRMEDVRIVVNPTVYNYLLNLEDGVIRYPGQQRGAAPAMGFNQLTRAYFDGIPIIVDHKCTSTLGNPLYIVDLGRNGFRMIISKPPQLTNLAKVSASESAYVEGYITTVYKTPRRIHLYDNNTGPTS